MDQVNIGLLQEILESISKFKGLVSNVNVNRSVFLKSAFFLAELRQCLASFGGCSAEGLWRLLVDVRGLEAIAKHYSGRRSRVYVLCKSERLVHEIQEVVGSLAQHMQKLLDDEQLSTSAKAEVSELTEKLRSSRFSADSGNEELASAISMELEAASQIDEEAAAHLLEQITRCLGVASLSSLIQELLEDMQLLEAQSMQPELVEVNRLLFLLDSLAAFDAKHQSLRSSFNEEEAIPTSFLCPITGQLMNEPVLVEGGATYEKSAIIEWFNKGTTKCPITNLELDLSQLVPNKSLENAIHQFVERSNINKLTKHIKQLRAEEFPEVKQAAVDNMLKLMETNPGFTRYVVALDGVEPLVELLKSSQDKTQRDKLVQILGIIAAAGDDCKVRIAKAGAVPLLLKALNKCHGDNPDVVNILLMLSGLLEGREAILSEKGSIITIASAVTIESPEQRSKATRLLDNLGESNSWVAIEAACSGVFDPLVRNVETGDEHLKLEMARAVGMKLELNDVSTAALVSAGAVKPLLNMLSESESPESQITAAQSLGKLSSAEQSKSKVIAAGAVPVIMKLLIPELKDLELYLLVTLANLISERECVTILCQEQQNVFRFLELLQRGNSQVQLQASRILHFVVKSDSSARLRIKENARAVGYIVEQLRSSCCGEYRSNILGVVLQLSTDRITRDGVVLPPDIVSLLMKLLEEPTISSDEKESILGILAGTGKARKEVREALIVGNYCRIILRCTQTGNPGVKENAVALLTRITDPKSNDGMQEQVYEELAKLAVMNLLKEILQNPGSSDRAREHAAANLGYLSRKTSSRSEKQTFLQTLLARLGLRRFKRCAVHSGKCNPKTSFCLVEAGVVPLLIRELGSSSMRNCERGLDALLTLLQDSHSPGVDYLVKNNIIAPVVGLVGKSQRTTEKAVFMLEKIFKRKKYRDQRYSRMARSGLSTTMTSGSIEARRSAAKALMHLGLMARGSTYSTTDPSFVSSNQR